MKVKYVIINSGGSSVATINRCKFLCDGLRKFGVLSSIEVIKFNSKIKFFFIIKYFLKISYLLLSVDLDTVLIFYGHFPGLSFFRFLRKKKTTIIAERNEYPKHILFKQPTDKNQSFKRSENYCKNLNFFDGFITCTENLKSFYEPYFSGNPNFLIIPSVVDCEKFYKPSSLVKDNLITYCGDWGNNKDGVPILVNAFYLFSLKNKDFKLKLIGGSSKIEDEIGIIKLIKDLNLESRVILTGKVDYSMIPMLLNESKILALSRPANLQAEGGFPSKLTEYLATGIPTLMTRVGEIDKYFSDSINIYLSKPDSAVEFSNKLSFIVENYNEALLVAENGRKKNKEFDYKNQSRILLDFIVTLINKPNKR